MSPCGLAVEEMEASGGFNFCSMGNLGSPSNNGADKNDIADDFRSLVLAGVNDEWVIIVSSINSYPRKPVGE